MLYQSRASTVEQLEQRFFLSMTPSSPRPDSLGSGFDKGERQILLSRLTNLSAGTYNTLSANLAANNVSAFDSNLLSYMRGRSTASYFFTPGSAASIGDYVNANLSITSQVQKADWVTDQRLFPAQSAVDSYTVLLPANINWSDASESSNPEYIPALNRQEWWVDLAQGYQYTGDNKYVAELLYELADWSSENASFTLPALSKEYASYAFNFGLRVDNWLMAYYSMLGSSAWTGSANSLMLYKLVQQGDVLNTVSAGLTDFGNNRTISIGRSLMYLGELFPELNTAASWESRGRSVVFASMDGQLYEDGSHREQSPGYAVNVIDDLVEAYKLDAINGNTWASKYKNRLVDAVDALWQQLSPNGNRPAIGDTYRVSTAAGFLKAAIVLDESRWPEAKPRARDAWLFGTSAVNPYLGNPVTPALGSRGATYALDKSGNYIFRSGADTSARQINFKAGPKGGLHGHSDLLNFELFGYGRPLISDPGEYYYNDADPKRAWAVSTKAHNTIGVTDVNHGNLESMASIKSSGILNVAGGYMISAGHQGYFHLPGAPTISRVLWFDGSNTMVVVDFVESTTARNYEQGFLLQNQNTSRNLDAGLVYTRNTDGLGNVRIQSLLRPGQSAGVQLSNIFTTSKAPPNHVDPASRYYVSQTGTTFAVFATLITSHSGNTAASALSSASWVTAPVKRGQSAVLNVNGTNITFTPPGWQRLDATAKSRGTSNDIAYDSAGRLHMVFYDRDSQNLKYAVRDTNGVWSTVQVVDDDPQSGNTPSLALDKNGRPGVAYQESANGDLRYAFLSPLSNAWEVQKVDVPGSTGGYPSLAFTRNNSPAIAYYNKTKGDLRLALSEANGWVIQTIDSSGDVGRFASLQLDPNRPTASKFAIAYEDTTNGSFKWTIQYKTGYRFETIDNTTTNAGGYISMQFYDSGSSSDRYKAVATYYDAAKGQLRYAYDTGGVESTVWTHQVIASKKRQGLYSKLFIEAGQPRVFFFDGTNNKAMFASSNKVIGGRWTLATLAPGGRELHYAYRRGTFLYTSLDEATGYLNVLTK
ncbi:MAG: alginate lyase family protein [Burkholderiales bacterium]|nr:alginate lyase family protein [Phycisphaerae bacterium]